MSLTLNFPFISVEILPFTIHFVHTKNNLKLTWHGQSEIPKWLVGKHELCFFFFC